MGALQRRRDRSWGVDRRLEFIETRLFWSGRFNRGELIEHFHVSMPQASQDIRRYEGFAPGNMEYDSKERAFVPKSTFLPRLFRPSADRFFAQLRAIADRVIAPVDTLLGSLPDFAIVPTVHRQIDTEVAHALVTAIREKRCISVTYQSTTTPQPRQRTMSPHALGYDGRRWHVRAWCHQRRIFGDFVLGRMSGIELLGDADVDPQADCAWTGIVTFVLAPNPRLSEGMRRAVECDFEMSAGRAAVPVRQALAFYFYKQLNLDRSPDDCEPAELQVVLLNQDEIAPYVVRDQS